MLPLTLALALGAPAPASPTAAALAGHWEMVWNETVYHATLAPDGRYAVGTPYYGPTWAGVWSVRDGVLTIRERGYTPARALPEVVWRGRLSLSHPHVGVLSQEKNAEAYTPPARVRLTRRTPAPAAPPYTNPPDVWKVQ